MNTNGEHKRNASTYLVNSFYFSPPSSDHTDFIREYNKIELKNKFYA